MKKSEVLRAWTSILAGRAPSLSIEITKECPLRCPGCYAFDSAHLGGVTQLRQLSDFRGDDLVRNILAVIDERRPLHVSLVGGDPLVRFRELELLLPELERRGGSHAGRHQRLPHHSAGVAPLQAPQHRRLDRRPAAGARPPSQAGDLRTHPQEYLRRPHHHSQHHHQQYRQPPRLP